MNEIRCPNCNKLSVNNLEWGKGQTWCVRCKRMFPFLRYPSDMSPEVKEIETMMAEGLTARSTLR